MISNTQGANWQCHKQMPDGTLHLVFEKATNTPDVFGTYYMRLGPKSNWTKPLLITSGLYYAETPQVDAVGPHLTVTVRCRTSDKSGTFLVLLESPDNGKTWTQTQ